MLKMLGCAALLSLTFAGAASSATIAVNQWYGFAFSGVGKPISEGIGITNPRNPRSISAPAGPWTFTLDRAGTLTVLDLFVSSDRFRITNFGTILGETSMNAPGGTCGSDITCGLADSSYSRGVFKLAAGDHSISGVQTAGTAGAGAFLVEVAAIPVPAAGFLLVPGLLLMAGVGRKARAKAA